MPVNNDVKQVFDKGFEDALEAVRMLFEQSKLCDYKWEAKGLKTIFQKLMQLASEIDARLEAEPGN